MTRVTIEISEAQRKQIKVLAAMNNMTVKDFILDRTIGKESNTETLKSFDDYKNGVGLTKHKNLSDIWKDLNS